MASCVTLLLGSNHCTLEQGTKPVPVITTGNPAVPAVALAGEMAVIVAAAGLEAGTEKVCVFDAMPAFVTVM